ncbi:MAG: amidinotransferase [Bergeyella sp.]|nr:amidinotransferase [Bergeyella sp.]
MRLNIQNETGKLKTVVLGLPYSPGDPPSLEEAFDAKSYHSVYTNTYPTEDSIINEMNAFERVLRKYQIEVLRPRNIEDCNQVFSRDIAFVIEDKIIFSNIIPDRAREKDAYQEIFASLSPECIVHLPEEVHIEGGDVLVTEDHLFVGVCCNKNYKEYKTARTNALAIEFLKEYFPKKEVLAFDLKKHDTDPLQGILHLDCAFNLVGKNRCLVYPEGFVHKEDYKKILDIYGEKNCFIISGEEAFEMFPNVFSISPEVVVSNTSFTRLNFFLKEKWGLTVELVPYGEIAKMGGLLRCSTLPLVRD